MSLSAIITPAVLDKVLGSLALLFLAATGGDLIAARHSASRLLACYDVGTEEELRLAAESSASGSTRSTRSANRWRRICR